MKYTLLAILAASAASASDLNIYTYDSFTSEWGPGPQLEKAFEAECECDIAFVPAGDGAAMLSRLRLEGQKTDADIALGLDQNLVPLANDTKLFANIDTEPQALAGSEIVWSNPNFVAYDWGHFAFVYNQEAWLESDHAGKIPTSLEELADSDVSVILEDPRASTPGLGMAMWVYDIYGEEAEDFWRRMKDNVVAVTPGWSEAYTLFLEGEADMVLSYSTSPAYHRIVEENDNYKAAQFEEGHALQIELAGVLQSSERKPLAIDFLRYLQSDEAQNVLMGANWMYPVANIELPDGFDAPSSFSARDIESSIEMIDAAKTAFEQGLK